MLRSTTIPLKNIFISLVVLVQVFTPLAVFAQESTTGSAGVTSSDAPSPSAEATAEPVSATNTTAAPTAETSAPSTNSPQSQTATPEAGSQSTQQSPVSPVTGPQQPNGSDSSKYTYNSATGLWESDKYTWDPTTKQTKPKEAPTYSYNPSTGMWDTTEWYYSPETGKYMPNVVSVDQNPALSELTGQGLADTGPENNSSLLNTSALSGTYDLFFDATISNKIGQLSQSGNALVSGNTTAGNAVTGDALGLLTLINMVQSSWGGLGSDDLSLFVANIDGNLVGDLYVDPGVSSGNTHGTDIDVTIAQDAAIHNDIDVKVASGNATVSGNTTAGNAQTGDARAAVNLFNMINSAINASKSFIGVLNINGSLNGDILLPPEMLKAVIAATGGNSNNQVPQNGNTVINANSINNKTINNTINAQAASGNATVSGNTSAGNALSGDAQTSVVLLNMTGKKVVASNAMLVFVNVMGSWVGLILDAPQGTSAVAVTGPGSNNTVTNNESLTADIDVTKNSLIDNNVTVKAESGDATVAHNTKAGNAESGDAAVGVNVFNMIDSEFEITDWFGVLFINVFGEWVGSFGVDTSAGTVVEQIAKQPKSTNIARPQAAIDTFSFMPAKSTGNKATTSSGSQRHTAQGPQTVSPVSEESPSSPAILAAADTAQPPSASVSATGPSNSTSTYWLAGIATLMGVLMLGGERLLALIRNQQMV